MEVTFLEMVIFPHCHGSLIQKFTFVWWILKHSSIQSDFAFGSVAFVGYSFMLGCVHMTLQV